MTQVRYQISEDDFAAAGALCRRKQNRSLFFMQILGGSVLGYFVYLMSTGRAPLRSLPGAILPSLMFLLPFWVNYQFRKVYRKAIALHEPRTMIADDTGIIFESLSVNAQVAWSNYVFFVEDERSFALMQQGSEIFVPVPKRELSAIQIQELRSLFETHIGRK